MLILFLYINKNILSLKLIIVDIQPAHKKFIDFNMNDFISWINNSGFDQIFCLYNGPELGYVDDEFMINQWYIDWGLDMNIDINYYEKSYGWFRDIMEKLPDEDIIKIGKYMIEYDILDSRDLSKKDIEIMKKENINVTYFGSEDYIMYIPELKDYLLENIYSEDEIILCGGGSDECYKEVSLLLEMIELPYKEKIKFIY